MVIPPFIRSQDFPARWMLRTGHGRDLFSRVKRLSKTEYHHGFVQNMLYTVYTVNQPWTGNWLRNPHHGTRSTFTPCTCYINLKHPDIICNCMFWICFRIPRHKIILYIYSRYHDSAKMLEIGRGNLQMSRSHTVHLRARWRRKFRSWDSESPTLGVSDFHGQEIGL